MKFILEKILLVFSQIKISHKLWIGFGSLVALLVIVSLTALQNLSSAQQQLAEVVHVDQPTVVTSLELADALDRTNSALGFYLLSKTEVHKIEYENTLKLVSKLVAQLKVMPSVQADSQTRKRIELINRGVNKYITYKEKMLALAVDVNKNQPGTGYSAREMAPVASEIQQQLTQMLISEQEEDVSPERKELFFMLSDVRQIWMNILINNRAFIAFRDSASIENLQVYRGGFISTVNKIEAMGDELNFDQSEAIITIKQRMTVYFKLQEELIKVHSSDKWRIDSYLIQHEIGPLVHHIKQNIDWVIEHQQEKSDYNVEMLLAQVDETATLVATLLVIGLVVGIGGSILLTSLITRPLNATVDALTNIAEGEGDLTQRLSVKGRDEVAQVSSAFNKFVVKIQHTIQQVAGSTTQLAAAAEQMLSVSNETSSGVQQQRNETEQVATAMKQMTATVQEVARHAESVAESARQADSQTHEGRQVVNSTLSAIDQLANDVEKAAEVIQRLESESENIGSVLDVIRGIADQTNLLALNAAIEAARAGEQGRGFAVVADEVRSLASRTQSSTEEIQQMIQRLQTGVRDAVSAMETGRNQVQTSVEHAKRAGESLENITAAVDQIAAMTNQIAETSRQQGGVAEEINKSVINISHVADKTASGTQHLANASTDLASLSVELQGLISSFKVE